MATKQTCPRRMSGEEGLDEWRTGHAGGGIIGQENIGPSCSFCGSLHPDRFMELVQEGWVVGPTDKSYKAYLSHPVTEDEVAAQKRRWLDGEVGRGVRAALERDGKTPEEIATELEHTWEIGPGMTVGSSGQEAKFYYQHLSEAQRAEFIEFYNAKRMKVGYPGHFYRLPFFCGQA